MGRMYTAPVSIGSVSASIDIFELLAATGKPFALHGFELGQTTEVGDAQEEQLELLLKRAVGSVTSGSGGGTTAFTPLVPNDTAAGITAETGNTTKLAVGTGTITNVARFAWNVRTPALYIPTPEQRIIVAAADRLVLELVSTPADAIGAIVGSITVEELV